MTTIKWFQLGLKLGISPDDLDVIKEDNKNDVDAARLSMLKMWLDECENPSWEEVIQALKDIKQRRLAKKLEGKYCS